MQARMTNPAMIFPEAMQALQTLGKVAEQGGVPQQTLALVHLRASQINGCGVCVDLSFRWKKGETDQRLFAVAAWRDTPYFTDAERAALALAEALTRLSDRPDPVPDEIMTKVLDAAIRAPSGSNAQSWLFVVVRDAEKRRQLGAIYHKASQILTKLYA